MKIKKALDLIEIRKDGTWIVPNRKSLNITIEEFVEFERARLNETGPNNPKYFNHYSNSNGEVVTEEDLKLKTKGENNE